MAAYLLKTFILERAGGFRAPSTGSANISESALKAAGGFNPQVVGYALEPAVRQSHPKGSSWPGAPVQAWSQKAVIGRKSES